jgi:hypothetical protein
MSDDDSLLAAVNAKLTAIVEASFTPPTWYHDWMRLQPGSTNEERLAVCQAIRDSGCLPDRPASVSLPRASKAGLIWKPKRTCEIWLTAWKP